MDIVGLYRLLNKKQEKKIILEIYYLMLMFSFDAELLRPHDAHTFKWDC